MGMLHCNMKLMWQSSYALSDSKAHRGGIIDFEGGRSRGQRRKARTKSREAGTAKCADNAARSAHCSIKTSLNGFSQST